MVLNSQRENLPHSAQTLAWNIDVLTIIPTVQWLSREGSSDCQETWHIAKDKQLVLLDYRTTPLESCGPPPAVLLMGRRPGNKLPTAKELLNPVAVNHQEVRRQMEETKVQQKHYHDRHADVLPPLTTGDPVRMALYPV